MGVRGFRHQWRRPRLAFKLALLIVGVSLMGVTVSFLLGTTVHRGQLVDAARQSAERLSVTVRASLEDAMMRNDREAMAAIIGYMGEAGVVSRAWLLDGDGIVYVGTASREEGSRWPAASEFQGSFVPASAPILEDLEAVLTEHDTLLSVQTLGNEPQCQECHRTDASVLGYLVLELPLNDLRGQLAAALRPMAVTTVTALMLMVGLLIAGVHRLVVHPIQELGDAAARLAEGELEQAITVTAGGEFEELAGTFEQMRRSLKATLAVKDRRNLELRDLNRLAIQAGEATSAGEIARLGLERLAEHLGVQAGAVYLVGGEGLILAATRGIPDEKRCVLEEAARKSTACRWDPSQARLIRQGPPLLPSDAGPGGLPEGSFQPVVSCPLLQALEENSGGRCVCLPLISRDVTVGVLEMIFPDATAVSEEQEGFLSLLAHEMGVAIHNLSLLARTRELATLEERDRVAREMHDRLAQALAYLKLRASVAAEAARAGRGEDALDGLEEIKAVVAEAYGETREAIFHLRASTRGEGDGLVPVLQAFAGDCARRYGLEVRLEASDEWQGKVLPPDVETQLLLAVQEAVFNACRHARPRQVVVVLDGTPAELRVRVTDDGSGFDLASTRPQDGYGLRIMQERMESIGGRMEIRSEVGQGTRVEFLVASASAPAPARAATPRIG